MSLTKAERAEWKRENDVLGARCSRCSYAAADVRHDVRLEDQAWSPEYYDNMTDLHEFVSDEPGAVLRVREARLTLDRLRGQSRAKRSA